MRKFAAIAAIVLAAAILLFACAKQPIAISASAMSQMVLPDGTIGEGAAALALVPPWPASVTEQLAKETEVPDFLTADQQDLFRAARRMYDGFGGGSAGYDKDYQTTIKIAATGGTLTYCLDRAFDSYDTFLVAMHAVFTDAYCEKLLPKNGFAGLKEHSGKLYSMDVNRGLFVEYVSVSYKLRSRTEDAISFAMVGHYNPTKYAKTLDPTQEYTKEYELHMEHTENGWRFADFAVAY